MILIRVAWRNIFRNRRRSLITLVAVGLNTAVTVFCFGMMEGMLEQLVQNATGLVVGEAQLHAQGYRSDRSMYKDLPEPERLLASARDLGLQAAPRSYGFGLVSLENKSAGASFWGVDVAAETRSFKLPTKIARGRFLNSGGMGEVVIGAKLAKSLKANIGSEIVVVVQAADGSLGNELFRVGGILQSVGEEIDRAAVLMKHDDFDALFVAEGRVHEIALRGPPDMAPREIVAHFQEANFSGVIAESWKQLLPTLSDMLNVSDAAMAIFAFIFFLTAGISVLNTMLMATHDRIREYGMIKALGATPWRIVREVLLESGLLSGLSATLGALVGVGVCLLFENRGGMDLSRWQTETLTVSGIPFEAVYHFTVRPSSVFSAAFAMCLVCVVASLYPALKAARLNPTRAMTHV